MIDIQYHVIVIGVVDVVAVVVGGGGGIVVVVAAAVVVVIVLIIDGSFHLEKKIIAHSVFHCAINFGKNYISRKEYCVMHEIFCCRILFTAVKLKVT